MVERPCPWLPVARPFPLRPGYEGGASASAMWPGRSAAPGPPPVSGTVTGGLSWAQRGQDPQSGPPPAGHAVPPTRRGLAGRGPPPRGPLR